MEWLKSSVPKFMSLNLSCECGYMKVYGFVCKHVYKLARHLGHDVDGLVLQHFPHYATQTWRNQYPLNTAMEIPSRFAVKCSPADANACLPCCRPVIAGRPSKKRIEAVARGNQTRRKASCSVCSAFGHKKNSSKCPKRKSAA